MSYRIMKLFIGVLLLAGSVALAEPEASCCSKKAEGTASASCCSAKAGGSHTQHGDASPTDAAANTHADHQEATGEVTDPHAGHSASSDGTGALAEHAMPACCSGGGKQGMQHGGQGRGAVMPDAMQLLHNHASLKREVQEIPNGVKTTTTTTDSQVLALLRRHPREMYAFYETGGSVRPRDPMFAELSRIADKVTMEFRDIENGIETIATSDDPEVVKLIRAHAAKVTEFVKRGHAALMEGAPLPEDYKPAK